jgi:hypothetical protein
MSGPVGLANPQITETTAAWIAQVVESEVANLNKAVQDSVSSSNPSSVINQVCEGTACVAVAQAIYNVVEPYSSDFSTMLEKYSAVVLVANNTVYDISTASQSQYDQIYINHGYVDYMPSGVVPAVPPPADGSMISCALFGFVGSTFDGPSGAVWMSVTDPNTNGGLVGGLCFAFSVPIDAHNSTPSCAVSFNESLETWFGTFNSAAPQQTATASLPAAGAYLALSATCTLDSAKSGANMIVVNLQG